MIIKGKLFYSELTTKLSHVFIVFFFLFHCIISPSPAHKNTHSRSNIDLKILALFFFLFIFLLAHILTINYQQNLLSNRLGRVSPNGKKKKLHSHIFHMHS